MKYDTDMVKYEKFAPTCFDHKGAYLPEKLDWYVLPVSRTRDSSVLEESNFDVATKILGGDRENVIEIHRFVHWGPGWFEIIIVNPKAGKTMRKAMGIESSLVDYPVLDDIDYSRREWEEMQETWMQMGLAERIEVCCNTNNSKFAARRDAVPDHVYAENLGIE